MMFADDQIIIQQIDGSSQLHMTSIMYSWKFEWENVMSFRGRQKIVSNYKFLRKISYFKYFGYDVTRKR